MTHHYDRIGDRIEDDDEPCVTSEEMPAAPVRSPREWCDVLRQIAREARAQAREAP